jgi:hypothetical protein
MLGIVHGRAAELLIVEREAAGLDNIESRAETRTKPHHRAGIGGNIGLIKGEAKI